ncbi:helicase associated domain-containing protein [Streptomyces griseus]|uniref:helicase associated domain-containing protein n=1 Tax=Streptomyces griseus TaxID=1911 RepID=UPI002D2187B4|nr:helicase associated domain-containing protein [Streptomyces griseus]
MGDRLRPGQPRPPHPGTPARQGQPPAQGDQRRPFDPRDPNTSRSRRLGLAAAQAYHDQHGHLDVPADYTDPTGHTLGTFITRRSQSRPP